MSPKKKLKEYLTRSIRKIRNRKGYGVHSPFAFDVITQVIEEKAPYYAYRRMERTYDKRTSPAVSMKVACLIFRLANRFRVRRTLDLTGDGGYSALPLLLVDSSSRVMSLTPTPTDESVLRDRLGWVGDLDERLTCIPGLDQTEPAEAGAEPWDMLLISTLPEGFDEARLVEWTLRHTHASSLMLVRGIQPGHRMERLWDLLCDSDDIAITIDLYDYGLAMRRRGFYKQHYVEAF